jgi:hypothetical protein
MGLMRKLQDKSRAAKARSDDRRAACRYLVVKGRAVLGWWNESEFEKQTVQIIDISSVGCWLKAPERLKRDEHQAAWLYPLETAPGGWIEGTIVSVRNRSFGRCSIRMKFASHLDYSSFKTLVHGPPSGPQAPDPAPY